MNISDPDVFGLVAKILMVNAAATLLLAGLSYATSALMLNGLAFLDKRLDPSRKPGRVGLSSSKLPDQFPG